MVRRITPAEARSYALATGALARNAGSRLAPNWQRAINSMPNAPRAAPVDIFTPRADLHPPPATPGGTNARPLAMDSAIQASTNWAAAVITQSFAQGVQFLGYPYLAELAQRPEYRVISQTIAEEMTRKWGKFEAKGETQHETHSDDDPNEEPSQEQQEEEANQKTDEKAERIAQLEEMFGELHVREECKLMIEQDGFFGRSHLYLDTGDTDNRDELRVSIGSGKDALSKLKVTPKKPLKRLKTVEAVWCYPTNYESVDPLKPTWYNPEHWFVMGKELHTSRLLLMVGNPVPDLLKPAYSFGGLSMSQMAQPYVNNWLQTRQSVNDLIQAFVVWGLKTNLAETLSLEGNQLFARLELFNRLRNNRGVMVLDKDTEEFFNVTAALSGLEALQAQAQEHMAAVSRIPLVKLLGIQPTGLNASSEGEIRVFYDTIHGRQEWLLSPLVNRIMHFCMLSLWGEIDEDITWSWNPLWALDEKASAEVEEIRARTAQIWIDTGVIDKMEERRRVAQAADSPYPGLDPDYEPDLAAEEEEGLVPKGSGAGLRALEEGGGAEHPDNEGEEDPQVGGEGGDDEEVAELGVVPFHDALSDLLEGLSFDDFEETKHPRDKDGKFATGAGGGAVTLAAPKAYVKHGYVTSGASHKENHALTVNKFLKQPVKKSGGYQYMMAKLVQEGQQFNDSKAVVGELVKKLAQSFEQAGKGDLLKKLVAKFPGALAPPPPPPPPVPLASPADLEQAKKSSPFPDSSTGPASKQLIQDFNAKYAGKSLTDPAALTQKVAAYKELKAKLTMLQPQELQQAQAQAQIKASEAQAAKAKEHGVSVKTYAAVDKALGGDLNYLINDGATIKAAKGAGISVFAAATIRAYTDGFYGSINKAMRTGQLTPEQFTYMQELKGALSKLPPYAGTTRRGAVLTSQQLEHYKPGMVIEEAGFMSTTKNSEPPMGSGVGSGGMLFEVKGKSGRDLSQISQHAHEAEVLFPSKTWFRVVSKTGGKIVMEEVGHPDDL